MLRRAGFGRTAACTFSAAALFTLVCALVVAGFVNPHAASGADAHAVIVEPVTIGLSAAWNLVARVESRSPVDGQRERRSARAGQPTGGAAAAATFETTGADDLLYDAVIPRATRVRRDTGDSLVVELHADRDHGILRGGSDTFAVRATVDTGPARARGAYTGSLAVVVAYQ